MSTLLLLLLVLLLVGGWPSWPYSREWGYYPSGIFAALLVLLVLAMFSGRI